MYSRMGHLFQGRYKSFLIDPDPYLQGVSRYIHLNPIRVTGKKGLSLKERSKYLERYVWSSCPGYLSTRFRKSFLEAEEVLGYFGGDTGRGRERYRGYMVDGLERGITSPLERGKGHGIVGEAGFVETIRQRFVPGSMKKREVPAVRRIIGEVGPERIVRVVSKETELKKEELLRRGSKRFIGGLLMELLYRYGGLNHREIGELMGVDYSAVSIARKRFQDLVKQDRAVAKQLERVQGRLSQG